MRRPGPSSPTRQGKPVFLSEFGTMAYGWVPDKPGPSSPPAVLAGSELVVRLANAGVDGFNRWSFLNRGDLDGQWQFVDTWDRKAEEAAEDFPPHPNSYFCLGLLSRFTAKHSAVLASRVEGGSIERVAAGVLRAPFAARAETSRWPWSTTPRRRSPCGLPCRPAAGPVRLCRYRYGQAERDRTDVKVDPQQDSRSGPAAAISATRCRRAA